MKHILLIILISAFTSGMKAQDMNALFVSMPNQNIPQLEDAWRKDLVELYNSGKEAKLKNTMNGYSTLQKLTDDYLLLQTTERSMVEMKLLPLVNMTNIICMVTTVNGPVADSKVEFFTTDWKPLTTSDLLPSLSPGWFIREDADKNSDAYRDAISRLDMHLVKYALNPEDQTLTATYTTPLYLSQEDREKVMPFLKESPMIYTWDKSRFK